MADQNSPDGSDSHIDKDTVLESPYPEFEKVFKNLWANNADAMSVLYSGTPALKTDFTRTGKRTKVCNLMLCFGYR